MVALEQVAKGRLGRGHAGEQEVRGVRPDGDHPDPFEVALRRFDESVPVSETPVAGVDGYEPH